MECGWGDWEGEWEGLCWLRCSRKVSSMTLLRGDVPGEEWLEEVCIPWSPGHRSCTNCPTPTPPPLGEMQGEAQGELVSASQLVEELLLPGLGHCCSL